MQRNKKIPIFVILCDHFYRIITFNILIVSPRQFVPIPLLFILKLTDHYHVCPLLVYGSSQCVWYRSVNN